ncbi:MAG: ATP-grasp domain-containing protein [Candidatus Paceibacterota bacterium]
MSEETNDDKLVEKNIFAFVMGITPVVIRNVKEYEKLTGNSCRIMSIWDSRLKKDSDLVRGLGENDISIQVDFSKPDEIAKALLPYQNQLLAINCRREQGMARFAEVLPHVPYIYTPTTESLRWASDKYMMRRRMNLYDPSITPKFTLIKNNTKVERQRVIKKIGFPMIIKPTNMAGSLLVSICYHEEDLEKSLRSTFKKLRKAYENDKRVEEPKLIAEEYMDGDMYSIDSYVGPRGRVEHCPLVKVVTGKKIGHDDFYGYLQITPPILKKTTVERAEETAKKAIHALGLRNTITHTELMKVDDDWKVVEIGARIGGFRHTLYSLTCGINHYLNDMLNRIPQKVNVPKKCNSYACAMKWFAKEEGKIVEMKGIKKIEQLDSFHGIDVNKKIGDRAVFARNGGRSVFNLILNNKDHSKLLADIRRVEQLVEIKVASRKKKVDTNKQ